jgi:hypothetical protein
VGGEREGGGWEREVGSEREGREREGRERERKVMSIHISMSGKP